MVKKLNKAEIYELVNDYKKKLELSELYVNKFGNGTIWEKYDELINEQDLLYEGLIKTYSLSDTLNKLEHDFPETNIDTKTNDNGQTHTIIVLVNNKIDVYKLIQIMQTYGWFLSSPRQENLKNNINSIKNGNEMLFTFEAKFDTEITSDLNGDERSKKYLHVTQYSKLDNIRGKGLTPKTNSKLGYHPERIYFLPIDSNIDSIISLTRQFFRINKSNNIISNKSDFTKKIVDENISLFAVLEVDLGNTTETEYGFTKPITRLFRDPNAPGCFYTMENIHPKDITLVKAIKFNGAGQVIDIKDLNYKF